MIIIDNNLLDKVSVSAQKSDRQRKNYNFHRQMEDPINRMLHALIPGTYVQPHKHENPDKREVFIIFRGKVVMVYYDDSGKISEHFILDPKIGNYGIEIPPRTWHSLIALEPSVLYEIKDGPYNPSVDKNFATWAPTEGMEGCNEFNNSVLKELNLI